MNDILLWLVLALAVLNGLVLLWLALRRTADTAGLQAEQAKLEVLAAVQITAKASSERTERLERELRREISESSRGGRQELTQNLATFQQTLVQQGAEATRTQNTQIDAFGQQLALLQKTLSDTLTNQLSGLSESNARRMNEVRETLEKQLLQLQATNATKLDEMRATVDEKLQTT
ncbi:MAG: DNA recombination protein RmuC, partial [Rhodoferax sp.]